MNVLTIKSEGKDDAFYDNLTVGLMKVLGNIPRITSVVCEKRQPCERSQITTWEQRHNVYLSDDMKRFYLSTDGFILSWSYQYSPNDIRKVGHINIPNLLKISLLKENLESLLPQTTTIPSSSTKNNPVKNNISTNGPLMNSRTKIFELCGICDIAKVCLVYESPDLSNPKIYLLEKLNFKWQFLADTFTEYLRMTIAHLGLPYWELCFSSCGLPSWTEQLFLLIAPHLLERNEPRRSKVIQCDPETPPFNTLDPVVFRTKPRCSRQVLKGR